MCASVTNVNVVHSFSLPYAVALSRTKTLMRGHENACPRDEVNRTREIFASESFYVTCRLVY